MASQRTNESMGNVPGMVPLLIADIRKALEAKLYTVAVIGALTLPDICAAMESADGKASKERYLAWLEKWMRMPSLFTKEDIYAFRCQVLHQGKTELESTENRPVRWLIKGSEGNDLFFPDNPIDWTGDKLGVALVGLCETLCRSAEWWLSRSEEKPS